MNKSIYLSDLVHVVLREQSALLNSGVELAFADAQGLDARADGFRHKHVRHALLSTLRHCLRTVVGGLLLMLPGCYCAVLLRLLSRELKGCCSLLAVGCRSSSAGRSNLLLRVSHLLLDLHDLAGLRIHRDQSLRDLMRDLALRHLTLETLRLLLLHHLTHLLHHGLHHGLPGNNHLLHLLHLPLHAEVDPNLTLVNGGSSSNVRSVRSARGRVRHRLPVDGRHDHDLLAVGGRDHLCKVFTIARILSNVYRGFVFE